MNSQPLYVLPQVKKRAIIPKILSLLVLGIIFYLGVLLNLALLNISPELKKLVQSISWGIILFCFILGAIISVIKSRRKYFFYPDRIIFGRKQLFYQEITSLDLQNSFVDKLFHTFRLKLTDKFAIKNIPITVNIGDYIKKLIAYSRTHL